PGGRGRRVLLVGDVLAPGDRAARFVGLLHRDVGHEGAGGGAVPVLLAGLEVDAVAGADQLDRPAAALAAPDALGDVDRLPERMGVPGGPRAGREVHARGLQPRGLARGRDPVQVDRAGEPLGRPGHALLARAPRDPHLHLRPVACPPLAGTPPAAASAAPLAPGSASAAKLSGPGRAAAPACASGPVAIGNPAVATMYPRTLLAADVKSRGEARVFEALRDGLEDAWHVFHSVGWVARNHAEGSSEGEIDFVLAHPEQPVLCLEVKGGGIECQHGEWFRLVDGKRARVRGPFAQAIAHRLGLERQIAEVADREHRNLHLGHCLAFPDITVHELALAPDAPRELILDRNDLRDPAAAIARVVAYHRGSREKRTPPGEAGVGMLRELLARDVRIAVAMADELLDDEEALITLTDQQASLLKRLAGNPRMLVRGCAGSGKTMLGVEIAKRLRDQGREVIFVCFNRALRDHLRKRERNSGIVFQTFYGLCVQLASQAKIELPHYEGDPPQSYWREDLPRGADGGGRRARPPGRGPGRGRGPGPAPRLARRPPLAARRSRRRPRLAFHGQQPGRLRRPPRPAARLLQLRPHRQLPQHPGDRARGAQEVPRRRRPRDARPARARGRADPGRRPGGRGRQRPRAPLRPRGHPAPGRRRPLLARLRPLPRRQRRRRPLPARQGAAARRPLRALVLDPRLQGPREPGRRPLRARGHPRRDARQPALRRHLTGQGPLRDRGAGGGELSWRAAGQSARSAALPRAP